MEKKFTKFELARIKRTAQNVDQYVSKKNRLAAEVAQKQEEIDKLQELIDLSNAPVKLTTGGYGVEQLVRKVVTPTDKLDKNGNIIKQTSYEFIYPDTIIPPVVGTSAEVNTPAEVAEGVAVEGATDIADIFPGVERLTNTISTN